MTKLEEKIRAKSFVVTTELTPPKGTDLTELFAKADALERLRGRHQPHRVAPRPHGRGAEGGGAPAHRARRRAHRSGHGADRNRIAIQADLLGASLLGVGNFLFMTGDNPKNGDHPDAKGVFDLTTLEMLAAARGLRAGHDMAGNELKGAPSFISRRHRQLRARRTWRSRSRTPGAKSRRVRSSCRRRRSMTLTCLRAFSTRRSSAIRRCSRGSSR